MFCRSLLGTFSLWCHLTLSSSICYTSIYYHKMFLFYFMCMSVLHVHHKGQNKAWGPLELELWTHLMRHGVGTGNWILVLLTSQPSSRLCLLRRRPYYMALAGLQLTMQMTSHFQHPPASVFPVLDHHTHWFSHNHGGKFKFTVGQIGPSWMC